jgi:imidazolonepropionase-like amidohydrolase
MTPRRFAVSIALLLGITSARVAMAQPAPAKSEVTVLRAARLFDGTGERSLTNGVVIVENGVIKAVGSGLAVPAGATVIDLGDATLLPGFIDAHTHITGESGENWYLDAINEMRRTVAERAIRSTEYARRTLMAGFTTVRNLGDEDWVDIGLRNAINDGVVPGPRILSAGKALGARGGHCDLGGFPYMLFGKESGIIDGIASGADQFRDAVRIQHKYGADLIKVCATGGVLSLGDAVDSPQLTQDEMNALVAPALQLDVDRLLGKHRHAERSREYGREKCLSHVVLLSKQSSR